MLQSMGLQRVGHDWVTELNWMVNKDVNVNIILFLLFAGKFYFFFLLVKIPGRKCRDLVFVEWAGSVEQNHVALCMSGIYCWLCQQQWCNPGSGTSFLWASVSQVGSPGVSQLCRCHAGEAKPSRILLMRSLSGRGWDGWWHHWLNGHESEQIPGDREGQGSLACCNPWGHKELDMT